MRSWEGSWIDEHDTDNPHLAGTAPAHEPLPPEDPIVAEVRAIREAQFAAAGYDLAQYGRWLQAQEPTSGHPVIMGQPRPARESAA